MKRTPLKPKRRTRTVEYLDGRVVLSEAAWYDQAAKVLLEAQQLAKEQARAGKFKRIPLVTNN